MPWDGLVHYLDKLAAPQIIERPATVRGRRRRPLNGQRKKDETGRTQSLSTRPKPSPDRRDPSRAGGATNTGGPK